MSVSDVLMFRYYELLSDLSLAEIAALKEKVDSAALHPKDVKVQLAKELVSRFHSPADADAAQRNFEQVFAKGELPDEIDELELAAGSETIWVPKLLHEAGLVKSSSEGRRMIEQQAVSIDGAKITDVEAHISTEQTVLLQVGKRRFCRVSFSR